MSSNRDIYANFAAYSMIHHFLHHRSHRDDDDDDDYDDDNNNNDDFFTLFNENRCTEEEKEEIKTSFFENREKKTPKIIEKPKQRELTEAEIIRASEEEDKLTNNYREYISNKKLLFEVLSELNGVNPKDPLFKEFY